MKPSRLRNVRTSRRQGVLLALVAVAVVAAGVGLDWSGWSLSYLGGLCKMTGGAALGYLIGRFGVHYDPTALEDPGMAYAFGVFLNVLLMAFGMLAAAVAV